MKHMKDKRPNTNLLDAIVKGLNDATFELSYERDSVLYEDVLMRELDEKYLYETYHVTHSFDKCIYDIIKNVNDNHYQLDADCHSGWYFDPSTKSCTTENIGFPIYVKVINDAKYYNDMSITDRELVDDGKIHITINMNKLTECNAMRRAILAHEFRHALEMYVDAQRSHIDDKQIIFQDFQDLLDLHIHNKILKYAMHIAVLFSLSEERARIDSVIHYLADVDNKIDHNVLLPNKKEIVSHYLNETKDLHLLYNMIFYLDELADYLSYGSYQRVLLIGYFLDRLGNTKFKISKDLLACSDNDSVEHKCNEIFNYLEKNQHDFMLRLSDCIVTHIIT